MTTQRTKILLNSAKCLLCSTTVISTHVHDFQTCKCGNLSVDGGNDYIRRLFKVDNSFEELAQFTTSPEAQNGDI